MDSATYSTLPIILMISSSDILFKQLCNGIAFV